MRVLVGAIIGHQCPSAGARGGGDREQISTASCCLLYRT